MTDFDNFCITSTEMNSTPYSTEMSYLTMHVYAWYHAKSENNAFSRVLQFLH